jgi:hypothetical protein
MVTKVTNAFKNNDAYYLFQNLPIKFSKRVSITETTIEVISGK